nr:NADH dehydrogenase subunit 3 [Nereididae sp. SIO BIC A9836]
MMNMMVIMLIAILFPLMLILVTFALNKKSMQNYEKSTPFECGFDPHNSARIPFSLRFFILAVLFLVFDIEIALLLPLPSMLNLMWQTKTTLVLFCIVLIVGLYHEWNEGSLEWK